MGFLRRGDVSALHRHPIRGRPLLPLTLISMKPFLWNQAPRRLTTASHPDTHLQVVLNPSRNKLPLRLQHGACFGECESVLQVGTSRDPELGVWFWGEEREKREQRAVYHSADIIWLFPIDLAQKCFSNVMSLFAGRQG